MSVFVKNSLLRLACPGAALNSVMTENIGNNQINSKDPYMLDV